MLVENDSSHFCTYKMIKLSQFAGRFSSYSISTAPSEAVSDLTLPLPGAAEATLLRPLKRKLLFAVIFSPNCFESQPGKAANKVIRDSHKIACSVVGVVIYIVRARRKTFAMQYFYKECIE